MEPVYNPEHLFKNYYPDEEWFTGSKTAKAIEYYLWEFSNLNAPRELLNRINQGWIDFYNNLFSGCTAGNIFIFGTGCGVLPLLAARAGKMVYACDRYPLLAKLSREIIDLNAGAEKERIRFFFKDIKEIKVGADLPGKCDLFVFDDFDRTLLETGFVPLLEYAKRELLAPGAGIIPGSMDVFARCVEISIAAGKFDLSPLAEYQWRIGSGTFDAAGTKHRWLSAPQVVCSFDFSGTVAACRRKVTFPITGNGSWNGIVYWHSLCGQPVYSMQYLDPVTVEPGDHEEVTVYNLRTKLSFEPRQGVEKIRTNILQPWHVDMVNDAVRNDAYNAGITQALEGKGSCRVLDIGCGSGLLSLMAARANPEARITGCEVLKDLSGTAKKIVHINGYQEQIEILNADIRSLQLADKADCVIHEVVASGMLGEGILHFLVYAKEHLALPGAQYVPCAARVKGMFVEHWLHPILGIDVSAVNAFRWHPDYAAVSLAGINHRVLSAPFDVFAFDFTNPELIPQGREITVPVTAQGIANAVVYWFELVFNDSLVLSSAPFNADTCWHQAVQYVQGIKAAPGALIPLKAEHDCYKIHFEVLLDKLAPGSEILPVPQYDKLWAGRLADVEKKYSRFVNLALSDAGEFREMVQAAVRIASDPGSFGVRAKWASRCAESFFIR